MALGHSGTQGTWALRYLGSRTLEGHLGTRALEALYLADSSIYANRANALWY